MRPRHRHSSIPRGFTLTEIVTSLVVVTVLAAIAVVMWRSHALRERRGDAVQALLALQSALFLTQRRKVRKVRKGKLIPFHSLQTLQFFALLR